VIKKIFLGLCLLYPLNSLGYQAEEQPKLNVLNSAIQEGELEEYILVPFQGTWVQGPNTFIFTAGDSRLEGNWIAGNIIGGGGQSNRYIWFQSGPTTGQFYFDTVQGRQGPLFVTLSNNNRRMTWRFGSETTVLDKVN